MDSRRTTKCPEHTSQHQPTELNQRTNRIGMKYTHLKRSSAASDLSINQHKAGRVLYTALTIFKLRRMMFAHTRPDGRRISFFEYSSRKILDFRLKDQIPLNEPNKEKLRRDNFFHLRVPTDYKTFLESHFKY